MAHGADLIMQLALNAGVTRPQLDEILEVVARQIIPAGNHFYIFGEPERLARPVIFIALREEMFEEDWAAWLGAISDPDPFESWADVFASEQGLARHHNLNAFAEVIHIQATTARRVELDTLKA